MKLQFPDFKTQDSIIDQKALHKITFKGQIWTWIVNETRIAQMVERHAREMEVRVSNPG